MSEDRVAEPPGDPEAARRTNSESTYYLLDRARAGDREALERLFQRHVRPLQRWARGRLPGWARGLADTDDLVQDTLIQTFKRIEDFQPRRVGALQAYLRQAVLNRIRDELRRKRRQQRRRRPPTSRPIQPSRLSNRPSGAKPWRGTSER